MNWIKEKKIIFLEIFIFLIVIFFCVAFFEFASRYFYQNYRYIPTVDEIKKYESLGKMNHHIRDFIQINGEIRSKEKYYYSSYKFENGNKRILIQGDSWIEMLDIYGDLKNKIKKNDDIKQLINGGTSSYSPSLMEMQFKAIVEKNDTKFDLIIAYIDQTDFMDEVCRYNKLRIEDNDGKLLAVLKDSSYSGPQIYSTNQNINLINISTAKFKSIALVNNLIQINLFDKWRRNKFANPECRWDDISMFMKEDTSIAKKNIFTKNLISLIESYRIFSDKVIFITHKHRKHYEGEYSNNIYDFIKPVIEKYNNFAKLHDISGIDILGINDIDSYFPNNKEDPASHPHPKIFNEFFSNHLLELIDKT